MHEKHNQNLYHQSMQNHIQRQRAHGIVITNFMPKYRTRKNVKLSHPISKNVLNTNHMSYYKMND